MKYLTLAIPVLMLVCSNKQDDATTNPTKLAINNTNGSAVTTVTVTNASDSSKTVTFTSLTANATTAFQEISFSGSSNVTCSTGCNSGSVVLVANQNNTITIVSGSAPTIAATSSGGGSGW